MWRGADIFTGSALFAGSVRAAYLFGAWFAAQELTERIGSIVVGPWVDDTGANGFRAREVDSQDMDSGAGEIGVYWQERR